MSTDAGLLVNNLPLPAIERRLSVGLHRQHVRFILERLLRRLVPPTIAVNSPDRPEDAAHHPD